MWLERKSASGNNSFAQALCHLSFDFRRWDERNERQFFFVFALMTKQAAKRCIIDKYAEIIFSPICFVFIFSPGASLWFAFIGNGLKSHTSYAFLLLVFVFFSVSSPSFAYKSLVLVLACRLVMMVTWWWLKCEASSTAHSSIGRNKNSTYNEIRIRKTETAAPPWALNSELMFHQSHTWW